MPEVQDGIEEVVDGEMVVTPPNRIIHAYTVEELAEIFRSQLDRKQVWVAISVVGLVIKKDPLTTRVPRSRCVCKSKHH